MSISKKENIECLNIMQEVLSTYVRESGGNESEIKEYRSTMDKITKQMKKSDVGYSYLDEVLWRCVVLIIGKEVERALIEYKFMVDNLKRQYKI